MITRKQALPPAHPLPMARAGQVMRLHRLSGESSLKARLAALGFVSGVELELIGSSVAGALVVSLKDCRMVLGHGMAQHLWVE